MPRKPRIQGMDIVNKRFIALVVGNWSKSINIWESYLEAELTNTTGNRAPAPRTP